MTLQFPELPEAGASVRATVVGPDGKDFAIDMPAVAPGRYEGEFPASAPGVYFVGLSRATAAATGLVVPYSPEFLPRAGGAEFLARLAAEGGGTVLERPTDAYTGTAPPVRASLPLWPWCLALAALVLPLDIAARRLFFDPGDLAEVWSKVLAAMGFSGTRRAGMVPGGTVEAPTLAAKVLATQASRRKERQRIVDKAVARVGLVPEDGVGFDKDGSASNLAPGSLLSRQPELPAQPPSPAAASRRASSGGEDLTARLREAKKRARK